ncbi:MAG: hypothetical protein FWC26_00125 [Fibromonadales bacterium]|nr:hypothetical protein [Fibromonadales bacterium]
MFKFFRKKAPPLTGVKIAVWVDMSEVSGYLDAHDDAVGRFFKKMLSEATSQALYEFANSKTGDENA